MRQWIECYFGVIKLKNTFLFRLYSPEISNAFLRSSWESRLLEKFPVRFTQNEVREAIGEFAGITGKTKFCTADNICWVKATKIMNVLLFHVEFDVNRFSCQFAEGWMHQSTQIYQFSICKMNTNYDSLSISSTGISRYFLYWWEFSLTLSVYSYFDVWIVGNSRLHNIIW